MICTARCSTITHCERGMVEGHPVPPLLPFGQEKRVKENERAGLTLISATHGFTAFSPLIPMD